MLDARRVLVAVASNFGAPLAAADQAAGAVLSIDPERPDTLVVPGNFAAAGSQAVALGGAVQLYTAQSPAFLNRRYNPQARTSAHPAAAGPRYLSINNAFGRPWIANAPVGLRGPGSLSVVDPDGAPLDNAPSAAAGGVFAGSSTLRETVPKAERSDLLAIWLNDRRSPQLTPGALLQGALGTAFLGPSPDGSGQAVFAVATADGALTQVHVRDGIDGLAPPGTVGSGSGEPGVIGIAFKWNPTRALYVADAARDRLLLLHLQDDRRHFLVARSEAIVSPDFRLPVDLAPAVPEVANPRFSSHTTLAGGSDLYVANRGDGTLLRIDQKGRVLALARRGAGAGSNRGWPHPGNRRVSRRPAPVAHPQRRVAGICRPRGCLDRGRRIRCERAVRGAAGTRACGHDHHVSPHAEAGWRKDLPQAVHPHRRPGAAVQRELLPELPFDAQHRRHEQRRRELCTARRAHGPV